jgi:hypothetical protein
MPRLSLREHVALWVLKLRLRSRVRRKPATRAAAKPPSTPQKTKETAMNLAFLQGYRTYIIAFAMLVAGLSQLIGVDLPSFDGQSAGHLMMEGLAILFLRKGLKSA